MNLWVEKLNPKIMLPDEQLKKLEKDDPQTDVYFVNTVLQFIMFKNC